MPVFHLLEGLWLNKPEERVQHRIVLNQLREGDDAERGKDGAHPRGVGARGEEAEGLAEREVAHDVKGGEVEELEDVDGDALCVAAGEGWDGGCRGGGQDGEEGRDVFLEAGFLGAEEGGGKDGAEETAIASVGVEVGGSGGRRRC